MRKKIMIAILITLVLGLATIGGASATPDNEYQEAIDMAIKIGAALKDAFSEVNPGGMLNVDGRNGNLAVILGEDIDLVRFTSIKTLFEVSGSADPYGDAWNTIKVQAYEKQFALERGILPTEDEIIRFTNEMRELVESDPVLRAYARTVIEAAGMTEDEYWNHFKVKHESPAHLTSIRIFEYKSQNGIPMLTNEEMIQRINVAAAE